MLAIPRRTINVYPGELKDIIKAFLSGKAIRGEEIKKFEKAFAEFIGAKEVIVVNSGRFALKIILETLELPLGSEIIMPAYTAEEVPRNIVSLGFIPVFVDINKTDNNIDVSLIKRSITAKTKAIIATHIFGIPCEIEQILQIAQMYSLFVIEDCAHALGARVRETMVGGFGIVSFFSFANSKPFNTFGGGAIATHDKALAEKMRKKIERLPLMSNIKILKSICISYFLYIITKPLVFSICIYPFILLSSYFKKDPLPRLYSLTFKKFLKPIRKNAKFTNIQAIVGLKQLVYYENYCAFTKEKAKILSSRLPPTRYLKTDNPDVNSVPYFFVIVTENAQGLSRYLLKKGIDTGKELMRYCPRYFDYNGGYPIAKEALEKTIQIPLHNYVSEKRALYMAELINRYTLTC